MKKRLHVPGTGRPVLGILPHAAAGAGDAVRLALRVREAATLTGRCACGAVGEAWELDRDLKPLRRVPFDPSPLPGTVLYRRFEHEDDCPAISPVLDRAYERGEFHDPAGDLLKALRREENR
jgi:hypothetical protein